MGSVVVGTGAHVPDRVVTNDDLARIMDTSDEWIRRRTGVRRRRLSEPGVGASDHGAAAAQAALADAGVAPDEVDLLVTATMTPDHFAPGIAPLVQDKVGLGPVAAFDLRQQCCGFLFGLDLADAALATGRAGTALVVGAEVHAGYLPFEGSWARLYGTGEEPQSPEARARATAARGWAVLFGDGAGAAVLRHHPDPDVGVVARDLRTDGSAFELIHVPGVGFAHQPYVDAAQLEAGLHLPRMQGAELFRRAVTDMADSVERVAEAARVAVAEIDLVVAHQANARIVEALRGRLGLDEERVPVNIGELGNTTAATLPLLLHDQRRAGRVGPGALVCFTAFGAGAHWGAVLYRAP